MNVNSDVKMLADDSISLCQFKNKPLEIMRLEGNSVYNVSGIDGVRLLNALKS